MYSNSKLITSTWLSDNYNDRGGKPITVITPHHMAGNLSKTGYRNTMIGRSNSANYSIYTDGSIELNVEEKNRAWTSGNAENDYKAVTIEVANNEGSPDWEVSDKALASLINLITDICQRNGIPKLNWTGNKTGNLTIHQFFQATACPGPYLISKMPYIEEEVNKRLETKEGDYMIAFKLKSEADSFVSDLKQQGYTSAYVETVGATVTPAPTPTPAPVAIKKDDAVKVNQGAKDYNGDGLASFVYNNTYYVLYDIGSDGRAVIGPTKGDTKAVTAAVNVDNLTKV